MKYDKNLLNEYEGFTCWKEMLKTCGASLIVNNYITASYLEVIIASVIKHGPYFVVAEQVAIAHSDINLDNIKKTGVSWNILKKPCQIGDINPKAVKYLIILATTNGVEHLGFLKNSRKFFWMKLKEQSFIKSKPKNN
ncbi:phosphotransferase protein II, component A-like protein [Spiroplasma clarkii]|uniref:PTS sugar transporter subunit IIA n=1 Tax=Spiroplasma clarkii TaxID=2139 RepID=UPI000B558F30|nr:PTS sugar transporter subunit IIA [Spiroplasma clarkii]ARU91788.1 phosphotransferase protein II, component A-like protein [Spiroplasma clarkii]